ncbi:MAG: M20 family metallopeptidase [Chloroflexota bacterium]
MEFTRQLVGCRSDSQSAGNQEFPAEALRCQDLIAGRMERLGMEVERWQEPPHYPVVAGRLPGSGGGRSLALNGHIDVVPVGDRSAWERDPWGGEVAGGRLWGRGAADMKGGVASCLCAIEAIVASGVRPAGDIWMHVVADEEVVGFSTRNLAARLPKVDSVVVAEPTDLKLMPVEGGLVHFRIEIEGRESHAGNRYMGVHAGGHGERGGVNAIEKTMKIVAALQDLERQWAVSRSHPMLPPGFNTLLPGIIAGGPGGGEDGQLRLISNPGTTPNYCSVEYNLWWLPDERYDEVVAEIEACVEAVCRADQWLRAHPPRFTWRLRNIWFPPADTPPDHPFIGTMSEALRVTGLPVAVEGFTAASELAWYAEQGMAGTIFGPGRIAQAHSPNEYVEVAQLTAAARVMAVAAASWCRVGS